MIRTSSYTIFVDLPEREDEVLLVHGYTGAYDRVSRPVASYLRSLGGKPTNGHGKAAVDGNGKRNGNRNGKKDAGFHPSDDTLATLQRRGYLTEKSLEEEQDLVEKLSQTLANRENAGQPGYVFMPTYSCNLRCPYCFQEHMRSDPANRHLLRTMQPETVDRIFAAMPGIEERHGIKPDAPRRNSILFFGGEPLLAASRPVVEYIMEKGRERGFNAYSAISNATELDAYEEHLGPQKISFLQITLDGPPDEHNQRRIYADGSPSFEKIASNITLALEREVKVNVRMNIDFNNLQTLPLLAEEIYRRDWPSSKYFAAYVAAIHGNGKIDEGATMDSWRLRQSIWELVRDYPEVKVLGHGDDALRSRLRRIFENRNDPVPSFRVSFCSAQNTMYIFDAFGDVYACWEHTGDPNIRVGHISEAGEYVAEGEEEERRQNWRTRSIASNPQCLGCRFAFYCGGGCANLAWKRTNDIHESFCDGFARRFRSAAALAYADFLRGEGQVEVQEPACDR